MLSDANSASVLAQAGSRASFRTVGFHIRWPGSEKDCCAVHWTNEVRIFCSHKFCIFTLPSSGNRAIIDWDIQVHVLPGTWWVRCSGLLLWWSIHQTLALVVQVWALCYILGQNVLLLQRLSPVSVGCKGDGWQSKRAGVTLCICGGQAPHLERTRNTPVGLTPQLG